MPGVGSSVWPSQSSSFWLHCSTLALTASQALKPFALQVRLPEHVPAALALLQVVTNCNLVARPSQPQTRSSLTHWSPLMPPKLLICLQL